MGFGGLALKGLSWFLRVIEFACAGIILGIFSYFLSVLADRSLHIDTYIKAVEGISGAAVVYTIFALVFVFCLGGIAILSSFAMLLDLCFTGAFIYLAYATRHGSSSCKGYVRTPLGDGFTYNDNETPQGDGGITILPKFSTACRLNTACFAVAIIGAVFFFLSIFVELALIRHHKKEKAFGPSPNNGYTAGSPKRKFWQRKPKGTRDTEFAAVDKHGDALPVHTDPTAVRSSYATDTTAVGNEPVVSKYGAPAGQPTTGYTTTTTTQSGYVPYSTGAAGHTGNTNF